MHEHVKPWLLWQCCLMLAGNRKVRKLALRSFMWGKAGGRTGEGHFMNSTLRGQGFWKTGHPDWLWPHPSLVEKDGCFQSQAGLRPSLLYVMSGSDRGQEEGSVSIISLQSGKLPFSCTSWAGKYKLLEDFSSPAVKSLYLKHQPSKNH